jgi:AraC-like DNA-binding protein
MQIAFVRIPLLSGGRAAQAATGIRPQDLRFGSILPVSAAAQRQWQQVTTFVHQSLAGPGSMADHPLVRTELIGMVAAAALTVFPNTTMTLDYLPGPGYAPPGQMRRAAGFVDAYADEPLTLDQIAVVAGVTGRALQYAFRRCYGTTPMGYLRRVRLERAHAQLQAADPADGTTVAAIARQWGWTKASSFSDAYRQRFGVPPSRTLRT